MLNTVFAAIVHAFLNAPSLITDAEAVTADVETLVSTIATGEGGKAKITAALGVLGTITSALEKTVADAL
jgi:hypothetical protein